MSRHLSIIFLLLVVFVSTGRAAHAVLPTAPLGNHHAFVPYRPAPLPVTSVARANTARSSQSHNGRLARVTAYWAGEGDYYTRKKMSAIGTHLHRGVCAVDPSIIPYGSRVVIAGVGEFIAEDTGSAVISRAAARFSGHTLEERAALVIDLFFERNAEAQRFLASAPRFASIQWYAPAATNLLSPSRYKAAFATNDAATSDND